MQQTMICPVCNGEGQIIVDKCNSCNGNGIEKSEDIITVNIPAGIADGMQMQMRGNGNIGIRNGTIGSLLILIEEIEDPKLKRDGINLQYQHNISFVDAILGTSIEIPTINKNVKIKIDPGTQSGKVLRLPKMGLPDIENKYLTGDIMVTINILTPQNLTEEEKTIIEKLRGSINFK